MIGAAEERLEPVTAIAERPDLAANSGCRRVAGKRANSRAGGFFNLDGAFDGP